MSGPFGYYWATFSKPDNEQVSSGFSRGDPRCFNPNEPEGFHCVVTPLFDRAASSPEPAQPCAPTSIDEKAVLVEFYNLNPSVALFDLGRRVGGPGDEPVIAWVRCHPDGSLTEEFLPNRLMDIVRIRSGAWVPLYRPEAVDPIPQEPVDMLKVCEVLGFDPTNHHNAAKCPYCSPVQPCAPVAPQAGYDEIRKFMLGAIQAGLTPMGVLAALDAHYYAASPSMPDKEG